MGFFSKLFKGGKRSRSKVVSGRNPSDKWIYANKFNLPKGGFAGGYGAWTFKNIVDAHSSCDDIVNVFELDAESCEYRHPHFGMNCYNKAWLEEYERASEEALLLRMIEVEVDVEELMDMDKVEEDAYDYACELADLYIDGMTWIPEEMLDWAYYDVSDHN